MLGHGQCGCPPAIDHERDGIERSNGTRFRSKRSGRDRNPVVLAALCCNMACYQHFAVKLSHWPVSGLRCG